MTVTKISLSLSLGFEDRWSSFHIISATAETGSDLLPSLDLHHHPCSGRLEEVQDDFGTR